MNAPTPAERSRGVAAIFDRVADTYDAVGVEWFRPIAARLVELAEPAPGEDAVDLGCGRGAALFPLAEAVGAGGRVAGVDLAARMIELTQADVYARGLDRVDLHVADVASPGLGQRQFDLAVSSLVIFFLPDPAAALQTWRELLLPGGRLAVSTFVDRDPLWVEVDAIFRPYLPAELLDARTSGENGPFASDEGVEALFADAGFTDVRTVHGAVDVTLADVREWQTWSRSHAQRAMWDAVPADEHPALLERVDAVLAGARGSDGRIRLHQTIRYTLGRRAS
ncbi:MAG: methyltransferase domain-containing protein [bacterium]